MEELFLYNIRCKYIKKKEKHKYSVFKNTKKDDKMNFTRFNTAESSTVPEK